ncbi:hypothetical protein [Flavobacterium sp. JP2137]|uniref:hypothetical protein n=1 Tax=Flavobacterium sp. JP2137 TaxID=3414510 RepID=UPI003D3013CC
MKKLLFLAFHIIGFFTALAQPNALKYVEYEFAIVEDQDTHTAYSLEKLKDEKTELRFYAKGGKFNRIIYSKNDNKFTFFSFSLLDSVTLFVAYSNTRIIKVQLPTFIQNEQEFKKTLDMPIPFYTSGKSNAYNLNIPIVRFLVLNNYSCMYSLRLHELFKFKLEYKEINSEEMDLDSLKEITLQIE